MDHDLPEDVAALGGVIVAARFNNAVVEKLIEGAVATFKKLGGRRLYLVRVAGALEIPYALGQFFENEEIDFGIALGCVIRGETSHYDLVIQESIRGCMQISMDYGVPVGHGILTVENMEQALERAGGKWGNKGEEAMLAVLELVQLSDVEPLNFLREEL